MLDHIKLRDALVATHLHYAMRDHRASKAPDEATILKIIREAIEVPAQGIMCLEGVGYTEMLETFPAAVLKALRTAEVVPMSADTPRPATRAAIERTIGQVFGRLTVIAHVGITKNRHHKYLCRCECGTEKVVLIHNVRAGATTSCGCKLLDTSLVAARRVAMKNGIP